MPCMMTIGVRDMDKDFYIQCHEQLIDEYMIAHPKVTWEQAYNATADQAYGYAVDKIADMADHYHDAAKEG
jgi:hypothetical protein